MPSLPCFQSKLFNVNSSLNNFLFFRVFFLTGLFQGENHISVGDALNNKGLALLEKGKLTEALEILEKARVIKASAFGMPEVKLEGEAKLRFACL